MFGIASYRCGGRNRIFSYFKTGVTQQFAYSSTFTFAKRFYTTRMHPLDDTSVESFLIPGAKVFERYFDVPLGKFL